ncbi:MAG: hypothetical protein ACYCTB_03940 [bacterium]
MKKKFSLLAVLTVAIAGFLALTMVSSPSFAASQATENGVTFSLSGQFIGRALWAQNQDEYFINGLGYPTRNTFQAFTQRLRLNALASYGNAGGGMPLVSVPMQFDMTNDYNPTGLAGNGYGTNGWQTLGYTAAATGFNHDYATFGLRQVYLKLVTPVGMLMFGRMPVKFGLGIAVNTNADGLGDFLPLQQADLGVFLGVLFGNETTAYSNPNMPLTSGVVYPITNPYYTHIQMGTIPTLELMTLKPIFNTTYSLWLTEAHLNQFGSLPGEAINPATGLPEPSTVLPSIYYPTANITFGGLSAKYSNAGINLAGEFDYFRGHIICSGAAISAGACIAAPNGTLPVQPSTGNQYDAISSYDLYLTGSALLHTSTPVSVGAKFGIGAPISAGHFNFTYYSQIQNTRTLFGDVIGSNWQAIMMSSPGVGYIYGGTPWALGTNLSNKWAAMVDATEHFSGANALQESLIYARWLKTSITIPGETYSTSMFGGHNIGAEFDLNYTHHFTKTLAFQAWGAYVWTGNGVESFSATSTGGVPSDTTHKNVLALGSAVIWNF